MRKSVVVAGLLSMAVGRVVSASVLYEPFDYNAGALLGDTNPSTTTSWLRAGVSTGPTAINVVAGNLTPPTALQPAVGNSVAMTGIGDNSGSTVRLPFGVSATSGTVYYSFTMRVDALTGSNTGIGGFFIGLNNTGNTSQGTNPSVVGAKIQSRIDPTDASKYDLGIFANITATNTATSWAPAMNVGDTVFIVAAYTFNTGSTLDDVSSMWINPSPADMGALAAPVPLRTSVSLAAGNDMSSASSLLLRQSPAPYLTLDEVRVGTSWADVTSVPEPASLSLVGLGVAGMMARRRK